MTVHYFGQASGERRARFIKNAERDAVRKMFCETNAKPSKVHQECKNDLDSDAKASGNRTGNSSDTMCRISSEATSMSQMDKDVIKSLSMIRSSFIDEENKKEIPPHFLDGFMHLISHYPLLVHMRTEDQVRLWHERCQKDIAYIDATGTIIANYEGKQVLYYALILRHPVPHNSPLPMAELISSDQSASCIAFF